MKEDRFVFHKEVVGVIREHREKAGKSMEEPLDDEELEMVLDKGKEIRSHQKKETDDKRKVELTDGEEEVRVALQEALDRIQHIAILTGYVVMVGMVERMSVEERKGRGIK